MNFFKKMHCRTYQGIFRLAMPLLPYKEPKLLKNNAEVAKVLKENNIQRVLLVTDGGLSKLGLFNNLVQEVEKNEIKVFVYDKTVPNPTTTNVSEALQMYKENDCGALIAFGGGSSMDCAKGVGAMLANPNKTLGQMKGVMKVKKKIPLLIAVPTTAGTGSETTLAAVITDAETRHKYAINDFPLIPEYALMDAELTTKLPPHITSTTGMDALTHAVEAYIGKSTTKLTRKSAEKATKLIFQNLVKAYENGSNIKARENMLYAAYYAGIAFTRSYVGYVHAIAHSLGGKYNIPHGLANAIILPYVLKRFDKSCHKKLWKLGVAVGLFDKFTPVKEGANLFIKKIETMNRQMNIPNSIPEIQEKDICELAKTAEKEANPLYPVPTLWTARDIEIIYYQVKNGQI